MGRVATIQALRLIRALVRLGWVVDRVAGSHHVITKSGRGHDFSDPADG